MFERALNGIKPVIRNAREVLRQRRFARHFGGNVYLAERVSIHKHAIIDSAGGGGGTIFIGSDTVIEPHACLMSHGGTIKLGEHCYVGPFAVLYGHGGLAVGNNVKIATSCVLIPSNHRFDRLDVPICQQGSNDHGIIIEDDVWLGAHVCVLDGVTIATGCVIGAGAVVTKSTAPYGIYVGAPARMIALRGSL